MLLQATAKFETIDLTDVANSEGDERRHGVSRIPMSLGEKVVAALAAAVVVAGLATGTPVAIRPAAATRSVALLPADRIVATPLRVRRPQGELAPLPLLAARHAYHFARRG
jgi:hypothetical protein